MNKAERAASRIVSGKIIHSLPLSARNGLAPSPGMNGPENVFKLQRCVAVGLFI